MPEQPPQHRIGRGALFSAYGLSLGVQSNSAAALSGLAERLPAGTLTRVAPAQLGARQPRRVFTVVAREQAELWLGVKKLSRPRPLASALDKLRTEIQLELAEWAPRHYVVHAGVVGWRDSAVVIPGTAFAGKSTLVAALVAAGATYFSDDLAVFDDQGLVHPYARPLVLRDGSSRRPAGHGSPRTAPLEPLAVGTILLTRYVAGAAWKPRPVAAGFAATQLMRLCLTMRQRPEAAIAALSLASAQALAFASPRSGTDEVVAWLKTLPGAGS